MPITLNEEGLPTGPTYGGRLFRLVFSTRPITVGDYENFECICSGTCERRGPLWVELDGVEWEDITCPSCLRCIDEKRWPGMQQNDTPTGE